MAVTMSRNDRESRKSLELNMWFRYQNIRRHMAVTMSRNDRESRKSLESAYRLQTNKKIRYVLPAQRKFEIP